VNFYELGGLLVRRRRIPFRDGASLELWNGRTWEPFSANDDALGHGHRLTDHQATALLHGIRDRHDNEPLRDREARHLLRAPGEEILVG
jgi:hypothetical protein